MVATNEALRGALMNLIAMMEYDIVIDQTMAEAAALVAQDFHDADQPRVAAYLGEIAREHRLRALYRGGAQAALRSECDRLPGRPRPT